jgi:hypothetical protein
MQLLRSMARLGTERGSAVPEALAWLCGNALAAGKPKLCGDSRVTSPGLSPGQRREAGTPPHSRHRCGPAAGNFAG